MPETVRVARIHAAHDIRCDELPSPEPSEGHTLVRVEAVGLCGSDLHWYTDGGIGDAVITDPLVLGHEMGGTALDGPHAGRLVAIDPAIPCEQCERCAEGNPNLCPNVQFAGHGSTDGGLAEVISWPTHRLFPLPEGMTAEDAAMLEPFGVAIHSWDLADVPLGARVAVVGVGPIGLMLVQLAAHGLCTHVTAVDPLEHRRQAALRLGADVAVGPEEVASLAADHDVVFEVSGQPDAVAKTMQLARPGARVCLVGIPDDDVTTYPAASARRKGLTIMTVRRMKDVYPRAIAMAQRGLVDLRSCVTDRFPLNQAGEAFEHAVARSGLKAVILPNG